MATLSPPARSFTSPPHLHHRKSSHRLSRFSSLSFTLSICSPLIASFPATSSSSCSSFRSHTGLSFSVNAGATEDKKEKKKKVLIVNTDGGGHAVIGFYFAKALLSSGHEVTIMIVGEESSENMKKPPFNRLSEIVSAGGRTVWGNPTEVGKIFHGTAFDVVLDNNGKDIDTVRPVADWAKGAGVEQFLYISSAGIYKPTDEPPHVEGDAVKGDSSHVGVETYIAEIFGCWAVFRPQYMIGSGNNKDCEEWFFDRIVRNRRVPVPGSGMQLTNIAHVRDLSSMLALAVAKPDAANATVFNCVSERAVTLDGMARLCAEAAGHPLQLVHYNPKAVGINLRKAFPFRDMHFYAEPRAAKDLLGWQCTTNLVDDLKERYAEYVRTGRDKKPMQFEVDDEILEFLKVPVAV